MVISSGGSRSPVDLDAFGPLDALCRRVLPTIGDPRVQESAFLNTMQFERDDVNG
jgi:hypothetical protein